MAIELIWEPNGVYRRGYGKVTGAERRQTLDQICNDYRFDELQYSLTDYLAVDDYEFSPEVSDEIAAMHIAPLMTNPRILIATVAVDPRIAHAVCYFMSLEVVTRPYCLFASVAEARAWISRSVGTRTQVS